MPATRPAIALQLLSFLLLLPSTALAAFIQTSQCGSPGPNPFKLSSTRTADPDLFALFTADVLLSRQDNLLIYRLQFTALRDINDANAATNRLTTLSIDTNFISGEVYHKSARLCDYLTVVQDSVYSGPPGGPVEHRNSTFTDTGSESLEAIAESFKSSSSDDDDDMLWVPGYDTPNYTNSSGGYDGVGGADVCPIKEGTRYQIIYINKVSTDRYFGSYDTQFTFISADLQLTSPSSTQCIEVFVTPYHPDFITLPICFSVLTIFVLGLVSNLYIYHFSPSQESSSVFLLVASSICNEPLLNDLTPDVMSLLHYLQFSLFSVCLNLTYPWFLPVIISYTNWVALIRVDIFSSKFINPMSLDGVYQTLGRFALFGIFPVSNNSSGPDGQAIAHIWGNFMIWISCCVIFFIILSNLTVYISTTRGRRRTHYYYPWFKSFLHSLAVVVQFFYQFFPLPFVAISSFLLLSWFSKMDDYNVVAAVFALLFLIIWVSVFVTFCYKTIWNHNSGSKLYSSVKNITVWSSVYNYYKPELVWFYMVEKLKIFIDGLIIGMGSRNGIVQLVLLIIFSVIYTFAIVYFQPFFNKRRNVWSIYMSLIQIVNLMLSVAFITQLELPTSTRSIIGDVQLLIHGIVLLIFLWFFILRTVQVFVNRNHVDVKNDNSVREEDDDKEDDSNEGNVDPLSSESRTGSIVTHDNASFFQLTDSRVLPGLSLNYMKTDGDNDNDDSYRPTAVSPITYEYLERIQNEEDSEIKALWQNRLKRRNRRSDSGGDDSPSWINKLKRTSTDLSKEKGFSVVGRKAINVSEGRLIKEDEEDQVEEEEEHHKGKTENKKKFVVVGRKPIVVKKI